MTIILKMVQVNNNAWKVVSPNGHTMTEDIILGNLQDAEEYIRRYVTSYSNYGYELVPLKPGGL